MKRLLNLHRQPSKSLVLILFTLIVSLAWTSAHAEIDIEKELNQDPTLAPMGKGVLFVPYIVDPEREPLYTIFKGKDFVADAKPGRRVALDPGTYTLYIGSGPLDIRIKETVTIEMERLTVVTPTWGSLIVEVMDDLSNPLREQFQVVHEDPKQHVGTGTGTDPILGEQPEIWILKPGLYRIMKLGESSDSFQNFVTVRILAGQSTYAALFFDDSTLQLTGGGEVSQESKGVEIHDWKFKAVLSGSFQFINQGYFNSSDADENTLNMGAAFTGSIIYDKNQYYFVNMLDIYESFMMQTGAQLLNVRDVAKLNSLFMYKLFPFFGPYVSLRIDTKLFNNYYKFSDLAPTDTTIFREERDGTRTVIGKIGASDQTPDYVLVAKSFSPTSFQESLGFNFLYQHGRYISVSAQIGYGFRQEFMPTYYNTTGSVIVNPDTGEKEKNLNRVAPFNFSTGPTASLHFSTMPFSFFQLTEDFITLLPVTDINATTFESETTASIWISSYASIQYLFKVERQPTLTNDISKYHMVTIQLFWRLL